MPARRAPSASLRLSPTMTQRWGSAFVSRAASRSRSGSGFGRQAPDGASITSKCASHPRDFISRSVISQGLFVASAVRQPAARNASTDSKASGKGSRSAPPIDCHSATSASTVRSRSSSAPAASFHQAQSLAPRFKTPAPTMSPTFWRPGSGRSDRSANRRTPSWSSESESMSVPSKSKIAVRISCAPPRRRRPRSAAPQSPRGSPRACARRKRPSRPRRRQRLPRPPSRCSKA